MNTKTKKTPILEAFNIAILFENQIESTYKVDLDINEAHHTSEVTLKPTKIGTVNLSSWTEQGLKTTYKIKSTGNGLIVNLEKRTIKLNYSEIEHLMILYSLWSKSTGQNTKIVKINLQDL